MPKWMKPSEELPGDTRPYEVGDRILMIVAERRKEGEPIKPQLVILEAWELGWKSPDDEDYYGYGPEDAVLWAWERDVCQVAYVLGLVNSDE